MKKLIFTTAAVAAMCFIMTISASAIYIEGQEPAYDDGMMHIMSADAANAPDSASSGVTSAYPGEAKDMPISSDGWQTNMPVVDKGAPQSVDPVQPAVGISEEEARKLAAQGGMSGSVGGGVSDAYPPDYAVTYELPYADGIEPVYAADGREPAEYSADGLIRANAVSDGAEKAAAGDASILEDNAGGDIMLTSTQAPKYNTQIWLTVAAGAAVLAAFAAVIVVVRKRKSAAAA